MEQTRKAMGSLSFILKTIHMGWQQQQQPQSANPDRPAPIVLMIALQQLHIEPPPYL